MAGGKQSPRQKMVNLMYLVFICMLALNMSKEVLSAFGLINEKLEASNIKTSDNNVAFLDGLGIKASENEEKFGGLYKKATQIKTLSQEYYDYLQVIKEGMTGELEDLRDYEVMDKADFLDQKFFSGDNYTPDGEEFVSRINDYSTKVSTILGKDFPKVTSTLKGRFTTGEDGKATNRDGVKIDWLDYHYKGFPLIASLTKITQLQADIKSTEEEALSAMLQGQLTSEISMSNYSTLLQPKKTAFYAGDRFEGSIVLGRTDNSTKPDRAELTLDGRKLTEGKDFKFEGGGVQLLIGAGNAGDHEIKGMLIFKQDGEEIEVPVSSSFATISKPNAALIAADKMNVVYRGVSNPMTISIPGIPSNKVTASAPGLTRRSGSSYVMNPKKGRTVKITAHGKLPDGKPVSSSAEFRIKDIPRPSGSVRGESGSAKMPRKNLEIATVGALLDDFDFDLNLAVSGFKFKVPGQPTVVVKGNKMDSRAKSALRRAKRGDIVQVFDVQAYITNNRSYKLKKVSPVVIEITN